MDKLIDSRPPAVLWLFFFLFLLKSTTLYTSAQPFPSSLPHQSLFTQSEEDTSTIFLTVSYNYVNEGKTRHLETLSTYVQNYTTPAVIYDTLNKYVFDGFDYSGCKFSMRHLHAKMRGSKNITYLEEEKSLDRQFIRTNTTLVVEIRKPNNYLHDCEDYYYCPQNTFTDKLTLADNKCDIETLLELKQEKDFKVYTEGGKEHHDEEEEDMEGTSAEEDETEEEEEDAGEKEEEKKGRKKRDLQGGDMYKEVYIDENKLYIEALKDDEILARLQAVNHLDVHTPFKNTIRKIKSVYPEILVLKDRILKECTYSPCCKNIESFNRLVHTVITGYVEEAHAYEKVAFTFLNTVIGSCIRYILAAGDGNNKQIYLFYRINTPSIFERHIHDLIEEKRMLDKKIQKIKEKTDEEEEHVVNEYYKKYKRVNLNLVKYLKQLALKKEKVVSEYMAEIKGYVRELDIFFTFVKNTIKNVINIEVETIHEQFIHRMNNLYKQADKCVKKNEEDLKTLINLNAVTDSLKTQVQNKQNFLEAKFGNIYYLDEDEIYDIEKHGDDDTTNLHIEGSLTREDMYAYNGTRTVHKYGMQTNYNEGGDDEKQTDKVKENKNVSSLLIRRNPFFSSFSSPSDALDVIIILKKLKRKLNERTELFTRVMLDADTVIKECLHDHLASLLQSLHDSFQLYLKKKQAKEKEREKIIEEKRNNREKGEEGVSVVTDDNADSDINDNLQDLPYIHLITNCTHTDYDDSCGMEGCYNISRKYEQEVAKIKDIMEKVKQHEIRVRNTEDAYMYQMNAINEEIIKANNTVDTTLNAFCNFVNNKLAKQADEYMYKFNSIVKHMEDLFQAVKFISSNMAFLHNSSQDVRARYKRYIPLLEKKLQAEKNSEDEEENDEERKNEIKDSNTPEKEEKEKDTQKDEKTATKENEEKEEINFRESMKITSTQFAANANLLMDIANTKLYELANIGSMLLYKLQTLKNDFNNNANAFMQTFCTSTECSDKSCIIKEKEKVENRVRQLEEKVCKILSDSEDTFKKLYECLEYMLFYSYRGGMTSPSLLHTIIGKRQTEISKAIAVSDKGEKQMLQYANFFNNVHIDEFNNDIYLQEYKEKEEEEEEKENDSKSQKSIHAEKQDNEYTELVTNIHKKYAVALKTKVYLYSLFRLADRLIESSLKALEKETSSLYIPIANITDGIPNDNISKEENTRINGNNHNLEKTVNEEKEKQEEGKEENTEKCIRDLQRDSQIIREKKKNIAQLFDNIKLKYQKIKAITSQNNTN